MQTQIRLGRVFGVDLGLHYSWFVIAFLIAFSLAARFRMEHPSWTATTIWLTAGVTALFFFAALLLHELSHALTARARGLPVGDITLFALGGVSRIERDAEDAKSEFLIGVVGPVTSVLVGIACLGAAWGLGWEGGIAAATPTTAVLVWLGYINLVLAAFNMIPGFPLDGGRVLRAAVWALTGDADRATRIAAAMGQGVALIFIFWGILQFFGGAGFGGLWLAFIGWFLLSAAGASYGRVAAMDMLRSVRAGDVMTKDCEVLEPRTSVARFVSDHLLRTGRRCFLVADHDGVAGLVTAGDVKGVPRERWGETPVQEVMKPLLQLRAVTLETPASECFETMASHDVHQLPVIEHGRLRGIVSRGDLMRLLQTRAQLRA